MAKLFISYAREDRNFVDSLAAALTAAGHDVWFDRDLGAGSFREQILAHLTDAETTIVVWSARSIQSRYVLDEAERAAAREVLLPIRIDDTDLPLGFGALQTFDLSSWSGREDDPKFALLLDQIERVLQNPTTPRRRPAVPFITKSLILAASSAAVCAPALGWLYTAKVGDAATMDLNVLGQAFALSAVSTVPVLLWCGFEVGRVGLSHSTLILRRALGIYAIAAIAALALIAVAIAGGVAQAQTPSAALGQIFFGALAATLALGALIAIVKAGGHLIKKLRR